MAEEQPNEPSAEEGGETPPEGAPPIEAIAERLAEAEAAFERGDYAAVRTLATPLAEGSGPAAQAAADLLRRTGVDPAQIGVLLACLLFFCFIVWKYVL